MKRDLLYVDDEPDNLVVFEAAFEDDFNIWSAGSGKQALEILEQQPIPVVVSDQRMPEMTGVEMFSIMRRRHPHIQRIILTGYTDPEGMLDAINQGQVFHFVKKPWERPFLMSVLIRAFQAHDLSVANSALTDQLILSERLALLGQATARLAHEMGNHLCLYPLIEFVEDHCADNPELVNLARLSRDSIQRLSAMIQEVKTFMQIQPQDFARTVLPLSGVVDELISFLRFDKAIPAQRISVELKSEPLISGNKVKLQQVLLNLVKNAIYAIRDKPQGRITIAVSSDGPHAVVKVSDTGCGMTPEVRQRIWDPFFTTKGKEGNGMGLDISRKLVEAHGGTIQCESSVDAGSTFEVRLPRATPENG